MKMCSFHYHKFEIEGDLAKGRGLLSLSNLIKLIKLEWEKLKVQAKNNAECKHFCVTPESMAVETFLWTLPASLFF